MGTGKLFFLLILSTVGKFTLSDGVSMHSVDSYGKTPPGKSPEAPQLSGSTSEITEASSSELEEDCRVRGNVQTPDKDYVNITITHPLFKSDVLVFGVVYQVIVNRLDSEVASEFTLSSVMEGAPVGVFSGQNSSSRSCQQGTYRNRFSETSTFILNWTAQESREFVQSNITFTINYGFEQNPAIYEAIYEIPIRKDCQLWLKLKEAIITWKDFPKQDCQCWFPGPSSDHGLVIEMRRLNVPCFRGYLFFSGLNVSRFQHVRSYRQARICGKLEELPESDRHLYFPSSYTPPFFHTFGDPVFSLAYRLVDYCYNVSFTQRNGSYDLKPTRELQCTFKIYLPYGNRIALSLRVGDSASGGAPDTADLQPINKEDFECDGLLVQLLDGDTSWRHCGKPGDSVKYIQMVSKRNKIELKVSLSSIGDGGLGMRMDYEAEPDDEIVGTCDFGWVTFTHFCASVVEETKLPWIQAEMECVRRGGHLASIRNEETQSIIDTLVLASPGYKDYNAYWIGASDKIHEGEFQWSDGLPFSYSNWFPGWSQHANYNRQPNDDGLSEQDCVEIRRIYALPTSALSLASTFMWNDRDCTTPNYFICERLRNDEPLKEDWAPDCHKSINLTEHHPRMIVSSPGFPRQYPDNVDCNTDISVPSGYRIVLDFEELVLENEPSYDFLEILENPRNATPSGNKRQISRRLCGDWSSKLKLLRHVSKGSKIQLRFSSDYSHHYSGFKARVSMENVMQCSDDRFQIYDDTCYLFVSYPEVTWNTAHLICNGIKARLASVSSPDEEKFIISNIRKSSEYRTAARYWLGARADENGRFSWTDEKNMTYMGWLPGENPEENDVNAMGETLCLAIQWTPTPTPMLPSGLYWKSQKCESIGGYVCKRLKENFTPGINFNRTVNGSHGELTTPNFPGNYYNNLDFTVRITGLERSRIVIHFDKIDTEPQAECLYDYISLKNLRKHPKTDDVKLCGSHEIDMSRFDFISETNQVELRFHSDYSVTGGGFHLRWQSVDMSGCPEQTLIAKEGTIISPNYPYFLLPKLNCTITILAREGKRVWLQFEDYDIGSHQKVYDEAMVDIKLGKESPFIQPYSGFKILSEGSFISNAERLVIKLRTKNRPSGRGFKATYKTLGVVNEERFINILNTTHGSMLHLNYPDNPPLDVNFVLHFIAPVGNKISVELYNVKFNGANCSNDGAIEVYDNYADVNGTRWYLCYDKDPKDSIVPKPPFAIDSFLNTLHIKQSNKYEGIFLNGTVRVGADDKYRSKLLKFKNDVVESCEVNPCQHGGKCVTIGRSKTCKCEKYYTGLFCALTQCDMEPCHYGTCELTNDSYKCHCKTGYVGVTCDQKRRPCEDNPCESRGVCLEHGESFQCRCHAWWEGARCERRMVHIPYKPLSERMLHEPFWLGLMTVTVVMGVIGLVWCAKRHFPEKIEKLLSEDDDRNRSTISSLRSISVREQLAASGSAAITITPSPAAPGVQRSLFGRLGIRKPSILSLTSPHASGYVPATARTFSLDDLLKPPLRRTPSPKKKRNNSTPTKKNAAEKKQILQQLISPAANKQSARKVSIGELMQMSERKTRDEKIEDNTRETKFTGRGTISAGHLSLVDPKLEKKVTFARLLSKVSQEMSSGSEIELGIMQANRLSCAFARPSSTPPSPGATVRSPNSTSSNQGSDSLTSSDLAIPTALSSSVSDLLGNRKPARLQTGRQKPSSADSILAMFRNFSSSSAAVNLPSSLRVSPSTTPTASSPQDDESSTSSIHTPVSFSSGPPDSPVLHRNTQSTIEVPVLDPLSAHKSTTSGSNFLHPPTILLEIPSTINKCLSPIRELPTPLPSPAITPTMRRSIVSSVVDDLDTSDDRISIELPNISITCSDEDDMHGIQDIAIDPQAEDGLIQEEVAAMHQGSASALFKIKSRPPLIGGVSEFGAPPPLVIPTLTVQTPSPVQQKPPYLIFPGSPPPRSHEDTFQFASAKQTRKMLKQFDKPTSLDLPCAPPLITITCNLSEAESDAESAIKTANVSSGGMTYLSPFSMATRGDHTASESNLSSSGYSSMASPGPSRCGSNNPLCPPEIEDPGPTSSDTAPLRRQSPLLKASSSGDCTDNGKQQHARGRSDSETLSDDPLLESNDEGIGTDHLDEKIEDGEVKSAKELEVFISDNSKLEPPQISNSPSISCASLEEVMLLTVPVAKTTLQLPSIVVQCDTLSLEKCGSPVSSRSDSPLSDRTSGVGRFSPQFYGRHKDILPFTDSDGLYDFPSSDKVNVTSSSQQHRKFVGRKREKKAARTAKASSSPTYHLELPRKESVSKPHSVRKTSPKRRVRTQQMVNSSSSSDSIASAKETKPSSSSSPSPDTIRWTSMEWENHKTVKSPEASGEETGEEANSVMLPKSDQDLYRHKKISRLRTISHQIRFLRRLELSMKTKGRTTSPTESVNSEEEDSFSRVTSPLLQLDKESRGEIRKSNSSGRLQSKSTYLPQRNRHGKFRRGEFLIPQNEKAWKKVLINGNGHSD